MKKITLCIAGGGSTHTPGIVRTLLNNIEKFPVKTIRLYDIDAEKNDDMYVIIKYMLKQQGLNEIEVMKTEIPKEAFEGCDFIFSQIRVGGFKMREQDEKIPLRHGLVGQETCGLGGFAYGLRSMGGFLKMMSYIQEFAPEAWVLNYTNPESIIAESVRRKFPNARIINACDMTIGIEEVLGSTFGYDSKDWIPEYYGLNHFGWYKSIYDIASQKDIMPELIDKIIENGIHWDRAGESWKKAYYMMGHMVKVFPSNIPNNYLEYYLFPDMAIDGEDVSYTRANAIMDSRVKELKEKADMIRKDHERTDIDFGSGVHGQYIVDMASSILNNLNMRFKVIVPNKGAIPNLRQDAVVEVPAYVSAKGAEPISFREDIPDFHKGLMEAQVAAEKLLVDAFFEKSYQKALQAFTLNQSVPSARVAKQILDEMIIANEGYWPELK
jgi:maltose-6'-phosphate glucosidase